MKAEQWIINGEVGISSKTIWAVMMGAVLDSRKDSWDYDTPHDPDDFARCWKLLVFFPEWRKQLPKVAQVFPKWIPMVREWDKLSEMYEQNIAAGHEYSHEMYDFMQELEAEGRRLDDWEVYLKELKEKVVRRNIAQRNLERRISDLVATERA